MVDDIILLFSCYLLCTKNLHFVYYIFLLKEVIVSTKIYLSGKYKVYLYITIFLSYSFSLDNAFYNVNYNHANKTEKQSKFRPKNCQSKIKLKKNS